MLMIVIVDADDHNKNNGNEHAALQIPRAPEKSARRLWGCAEGDLMQVRV